jgi:hypothetical protein
MLPTDEFSTSDAFGDGYIAHIQKKNEASEIIVRELIYQWLEHYKNTSDTNTAIQDFSIDAINIIDNKKNNNQNYVIVAQVEFSIIPSSIPSAFASFAGDPISPADKWWHLVSTFGILQLSEEYFLRILSGWGT